MATRIVAIAVIEQFARLSVVDQSIVFLFGPAGAVDHIKLGVKTSLRKIAKEVR